MHENQVLSGDNLTLEKDYNICSAKIFICCLSQDYADSVCCCKELERAFELAKPIIPVLLENFDIENGLTNNLTRQNLFPYICGRRSFNLIYNQGFNSYSLSENMLHLLDSLKSWVRIT
ncbi:hypothetical protein TrispH2_009718 [Trichoplax sp. H2]|nr:hypothetical protein TrispH2_009718 [Trichoplax sp. H2]|eukprot:RDD38350.1 hypothetical protein TrispH2_009718 [Trichoplax sp. H2]